MACMNVVDGKALTTDLVNPALERLKGEVIPELDATLQKAIASAELAIGRQVAGILTGAAGLLMQAASLVPEVADSLDGRTLDASVQVSIRLSKAPAPPTIQPDVARIAGQGIGA